jgi:hypothetical protein
MLPRKDYELEARTIKNSNTFHIQAAENQR